MAERGGAPSAAGRRDSAPAGERGNGPERLAQSRAALDEWLVEHEYESLAQARGSMSLQKCPSTQAFTRANYMRILNGWKA